MVLAWLFAQQSIGKQSCASLCDMDHGMFCSSTFGKSIELKQSGRPTAHDLANVKEIVCDLQQQMGRSVQREDGGPKAYDL